MMPEGRLTKLPASVLALAWARAILSSISAGPAGSRATHCRPARHVFEHRREMHEQDMPLRHPDSIGSTGWERPAPGC